VAITVERALLLAVLVVCLFIDVLRRRPPPLAPRLPLFAQLPNGELQDHALALLESSIIGIYDGDTPVCAAVFISDTLALTVEHDASPSVGAILHARSAPDSEPDSEPLRQWAFQVIGVSKTDDLVLLQRISGPPPAGFLPIDKTCPSSRRLKGQKVVLATFGIAVVARAGDFIELGVAVNRPDVKIAGRRHFVYASTPGPGDSGSAVISLDGKLIGLHLGGWNHADSPLPSPEVKAGAKHVAAAEARRNRERLVAMGLGHAGTETINSVINLARTLNVGGYAIFLSRDVVNALATSGSTASGTHEMPAQPAAAAGPAAAQSAASAAFAVGGAATTIASVRQRAGRKRAGSRG